MKSEWESCPKRHASQVQHLLDCPPEPMTESPAGQIREASCGPTPRGAWVCLPQACNRAPGMCPERLVFHLERNGTNID